LRPHYILFGAAFTVAVAMALGRILLRWTGAPLDRREAHALAFPLGAAMLSVLNCAICASQMALKGVFLAVGVLILFAARRPPLYAEPPAVGLPKFWRFLLAAGFSVFFVICFLHAMAPEISPDGSTYHLGLTARILRHHGFERITWNMYAALPQGVEMLFLEAFAFGRHSAAALVHLAFLVDLVVLLLLFGRRAGQPVAGACAALLVMASPMAGVDGASAYVDVAGATAAFSLFYLLEIWDGDRRSKWLPAIGLMAGYCFAVKYTLATAIPYALLRVAKKWWLAALAAAVVALPWVIRNWIWLDNPLAPFFNQIFHNRYITISFEKEYIEYFRSYGFSSPWRVIWDMTVRGTLSGLLGPVFLLAPVGLVALRWRLGRKLLLAALVIGITYFGNIGTRFLLPALPFIALAMALVLTRVRWVAAAVVVLHLVLGWPGMVGRYADPGAWRVRRIRVQPALRLPSEDDFLVRNLPHYIMARQIEARTPPGARILMFDDVPEAYTTREVRVVYKSAENSAAGVILWTPLVPESAPVMRRRFEYPEQALGAIRVTQTAVRPEAWTVAELRVYRGSEEVPRAPAWKLRARPYPWSVTEAFDNSPVTRWSANEPARPGQFVEVDFGGTTRTSAVVIEDAASQGGLRLKLEGREETGNWRVLAAAPSASEAARPLGLRRAAAEELKRRGFTHLVVWRKDFGSEDFKKNAGLWGIRAIGEASDGILYELP
jgi:hypothetical protein